MRKLATTIKTRCRDTGHTYHSGSFLQKLSDTIECYIPNLSDNQRQFARCFDVTLPDTVNVTNLEAMLESSLDKLRNVEQDKAMLRILNGMLDDYLPFAIAFFNYLKTTYEEGSD